jgi:hypothetical protein
VARHVWSVLCTRATIDSGNQMLSMFDVVEDLKVHLAVPAGIQIPEKPAIPLSVVLVSLWERSNLSVPEPKATFQIRIVSPKGRELAKLEQVHSMDGPLLRSRALITIQLGIDESGRYQFRVDERRGKAWKEVALIPLTVALTVGPAVTPNMLS